MRDSAASLHITYKKKYVTDIEKCGINLTVVNGQKMKCEIKFLVNMKLKGGETVKITKVVYIPQAVKNILSVWRLISKETMMGATQDKITIKKNSVNIILDAIKGKNAVMMFYLKEKIYAPKGSKPQEVNTSLPEENKDGNYEK